MKAKGFLGIFIILVLLLLFNPMFAGASQAEIRIYIDDTMLYIPEDLGKPFIDSQSRTQIPVRAVSEGLGYRVHWDAGSRSVTIFKSESEQIHLVIGSNEVHTPSGTVIMDTSAVIIGQRTYLPLRFVSEALGYEVDYHWSGHHHININSPKTALEFYRPDPQTLPDEIANWIELSKEIPLVQDREYMGQRYVLITEGMKPTGGYSVEVVGVYKRANILEIWVQSIEPGPDEAVTQAITYPFDLIILEEKALELRFIDVSDKDRFFMGLLGIDYIDRPVAASSQWIKIFSPAPGQEIEDAIYLTGLSNVFEGTVNYELVTGTGEILLEGFTTGAMGAWGYFEKEIELPQGLSGRVFYLELFSISAEDGSKMFPVTIPINIIN